MDLIWVIVIGIAAALVGCVAGFMIRKSIAEKKIGSAEAQARHILEDTIKNAESAKKESIISAKEEIFQMKKEAEFDLKERRKEVSRLERRVTQKEEALDAKIEGMEKKRTAKTTRKAIEERSGRERGSSPRSIMPLERSKYLSSR